MSDFGGLTATLVREMLRYDSGTGLFHWRFRNDASKKWNSKWSGRVAGFLANDGYVVIKINNKAYKAHRLAWLYMSGDWPSNDIDHLDLDKSNNRWGNLRHATRSQNKANMRKRADNTTGLKGVTFQKDRQKWRAQLGSSDGPTNLGAFDCPAAAHFAYIVAADSKFGKFARAS